MGEVPRETFGDMPYLHSTNHGEVARYSLSLKNKSFSIWHSWLDFARDPRWARRFPTLLCGLDQTSGSTCCYFQVLESLSKELDQ